MPFVASLILLVLLVLAPLWLPALTGRMGGEAWSLRQRYRAFWLASLVLLGSTVIYRYVGSAPDVLIRQELDAALAQSDETRWKALLAHITERLAERPDNGTYLRLLAEDAASREQWPDAARYYTRLAELSGQDPQVVALALTARFMAAGRTIDDALRRDMEAVLSMEPHQPSIRGMLGMAAFQSGNYAEAVAQWSKAVQGLPADDPVAVMLRDGIARARAAGGLPALAVEGPALAVQLSLASPVEAPADTPVFVFLSAEGSRMPLAARRLTLGQLPLTISLGPADLLGGQAWPGSGRVQVKARLALGGQATGSAGDPEAHSDWLDAAALPGSLSLVLPAKK